MERAVGRPGKKRFVKKNSADYFGGELVGRGGSGSNRSRSPGWHSSAAQILPRLAIEGWNLPLDIL